jgi:DNA-directed RNA polymerase sigma subunit (sigma70/sigma32)
MEAQILREEIIRTLGEYRVRKLEREAVRRELHRKIANSDLGVTEIARATGYSRERIRQIRKAAGC